MSEQRRPVFGEPEELSEIVVLGETVDCIKCPACHKLFGLEHYQFYQNDSYSLHGDPGHLYGITSCYEQHIYSCPHCGAHSDTDAPFYCPVIEARIYDECEGCKLPIDMACSCPIRNSKRYYNSEEFEYINRKYFNLKATRIITLIFSTPPAGTTDDSAQDANEGAEKEARDE